MRSQTFVDEEKVTVPPQPEPEPDRHPVSVWMQYAKDLGVMPEVVAGAAAHADKKELTLDEVREAVRAYLTREV